jgi:hypothetical protein
MDDKGREVGAPSTGTPADAAADPEATVIIGEAEAAALVAAAASVTSTSPSTGEGRREDRRFG